MYAEECFFSGLKSLTSVDESITTEHYSRTKRTTRPSLECSTCLFRSNLFPVNPGQLDDH